MIFCSIYIKEGMAERTFNFSKGVNQIFSKENSKGKTTLLRFMLYSLGYSIPSTRKIRFDHCEVVAQIYCDDVGDMRLSRLNNDFIEVMVNGEKKTYVLPDQLYELHSIIFEFYNTKRPHRTLKNRTPCQMEEDYQK